MNDVTTTSTKKHKMSTSILFSRSHNATITEYAIIKFLSSDSCDPEVLLPKFQKAITKWITETESGKAAWCDSSQDFNIGDFSLHEGDPDLQKYLSEEGLTVTIENMSNGAPKSYDMILANSDELEDIFDEDEK